MADNQPSDNRKLAGKYNSVEDLEKGYSELMKEIARVKGQGDQAQARAEAVERYSKQLESMIESSKANPSAPQVNIVDENGEFDIRALEQVLESKIQPIAQRAQNAEQTTATLLNLLQENAKTSANFWGKGDVVDSKFSQQEMNRFLHDNDGIRKVHEAMLASETPDTRGAAYEYVFSLWKNTRQPGKPDINEKQKQAATSPTPSGGVPESPAGEGFDAERLQKLQAHAAFSRDPNAIMAALREQFKDTPMMEDLQEYAKQRGWKP